MRTRFATAFILLAATDVAAGFASMPRQTWSRMVSPPRKRDHAAAPHPFHSHPASTTTTTALPASRHLLPVLSYAGLASVTAGALHLVQPFLTGQGVALVGGCDHSFCSLCILNWATQKRKCPLCLETFSHLWLYRRVDGSFNDYLVETAVETLLGAPWFRRAVSCEYTPQEDQQPSLRGRAPPAWIAQPVNLADPRFKGWMPFMHKVRWTDAWLRAHPEIPDERLLVFLRRY